MEKKPVANSEELVRKLQEKLRHERPRWLRWVPLLAMVLLGVLALLGWIMYPAPDRPRLTMTALDVLSLPGQPAAVQAYFDPLFPDVKVDSLAGLQASFGLSQNGLEGGAATRLTSSSDKRGRTSAALDVDAAANKVTFLVRQIAQEKHQDAIRDLGAVHVVAADTPLLLVDAEETLAELDPSLWTKTNPLEIPVRGGAAEALRAVQLSHKTTIVYFAVGIAPPREYRRIRNWVGLKAMGKDGLPEGPVLGRIRYDGDDAAAARNALFRDVRQRFTGPLVALVRGAEAAEQCVASGIRAIAMGGGDFPAEVITIKSWQELPTAINK